jgi:hypothetical protein
MSKEFSVNEIVANPELWKSILVLDADGEICVERSLDVFYSILTDVSKKHNLPIYERKTDYWDEHNKNLKGV